ncbi:MAG: GNAT family N-acetyltransferase [Chlamydiota bacterium]
MKGERGLKGIEFVTGGAELLSLIRPLWEALSRYHGENSTHFTEEFAGFNFSFRERRLVEKARRGEVRVELVAESGAGGYAAYCVSSVSRDGEGEIDSLFVDERFRGRGLGSELMRRALEWMDAAGATSRTVVVAEGNERAHGFYRKFGFLPFSVTLALKNEPGRR